METKTFLFKLFIRSGNGQEFNTGSKLIAAKNYDDANKLFKKLDIPFCHFVTVETIKN